MKIIANQKITPFAGLSFQIPKEDWEFLCQNRFFTNTPSQEVIRAEFVSGTGITEHKKEKWNKASQSFIEYIDDLRQIKSLDINAMARNILTDEEKYDEIKELKD